MLNGSPNDRSPAISTITQQRQVTDGNVPSAFEDTAKTLKTRTLENIAVITLKFEQSDFTIE